MKYLTSKLTWLFLLACSLTILTASTIETNAPKKCEPIQMKQVKAKKITKSKTKQPLYKSLLSHF